MTNASETLYKEMDPLVANEAALQIYAAWYGNSGRIVKNSSDRIVAHTPVGVRQLRHQL